MHSKQLSPCHDRHFVLLILISMSLSLTLSLSPSSSIQECSQVLDQAVNLLNDRYGTSYAIIIILTSRSPSAFLQLFT